MNPFWHEHAHDTGARCGCTRRVHDTWSGDEPHDCGKESVHLYRAPVSCTRVVHPYRACVRAKTGSCVLYPGVPGYREYVIFNMNIQEFRPGRSTMQWHCGLHLFFKNILTGQYMACSIKTTFYFFWTNGPWMTLFGVDRSKDLFSLRFGKRGPCVRTLSTVHLFETRKHFSPTYLSQKVVLLWCLAVGSVTVRSGLPWLTNLDVA